jgi:hypothetical protein
MSFGAKLLTTGTVCSAFQVTTALCSTDKQPKTWNTGAGVEYSIMASSCLTARSAWGAAECDSVVFLS